MKYTLITAGFFALVVSGCAGPSAGVIPTDANGNKRPPDISAKYVEAGAWMNNNRVEKLDYPDFADAKCKERGFEKYEAYDSGMASSTSWGGMPTGDTARTVDIWCK
ncbi:hypothetical protein [Simiduia aestuariiviva]|uniref:Lipoprotein n=1 Tax=Simiduia aestuariiviva TaxID=1510459 RepID=A0A839UMX7_9GAMM|nr:hypothetical protein [Simiduia aestuariiviva]MBB3167900.1 hypothetical protein [Simiduia aestuariiviva]